MKVSDPTTNIEVRTGSEDNFVFFVNVDGGKQCNPFKFKYPAKMGSLVQQGLLLIEDQTHQIKDRLQELGGLHLWASAEGKPMVTMEDAGDDIFLVWKVGVGDISDTVVYSVKEGSWITAHCEPCSLNRAIKSSVVFLHNDVVAKKAAEIEIVKTRWDDLLLKVNKTRGGLET